MSKKKPESREKVPPPRRRRARIWVYRLVSAGVLPVLLLLGLELGLRAAGVGLDMGFVRGETRDDQPVIVSNVHFMERFFHPALAREVLPFQIPAKKGKDAFRIFLLGGSAAQGDPEPAFGIARILDHLLSDRYPGVEFEVVNAAISAINSHVVLPIAEACAKLDPDLFVVYLGNNEVVGPYGAGTVFAPLASSRWLIRKTVAFKGTRLGQLGKRWLKSSARQPTEWRGMEMFQSNQVRATDPRMETVYDHFEANLSDICAAGARAGVPVLLSTVGVSLKDCGPFGSLHRPDLSDEAKARWEGRFEEGIRLEEESSFDRAIESYLEAEAIDPEYADLQFRLGRCRLASGAAPDALERFRRARELDTLRFRADRRINEIIREVALALEPRGVRLVDTERVFADESPDGIPGTNFLYEHVHLNFDGNYRVARLLLDALEGVAPDALRIEGSARPVLDRSETARRIAFTTWNEMRVAEKFLGRMQRPPFTGQLNHEEQMASFRRIAQEARKRIDSGGLAEVSAVYDAAAQQPGVHWSLLNLYARFLLNEKNDVDGAERQMRRVIEQIPFFGDMQLTLAQLLIAQKRLPEAEECFRRALRYRPDSAPVRANLGVMLGQQGKYDEALRHLNGAISSDPHNETAHFHIAKYLNDRSPRDPEVLREAIKHLEIVLEKNPEHQEARKGLNAMQQALRERT